jgi:hypothetical protein
MERGGPSWGNRVVSHTSGNLPWRSYSGAFPVVGVGESVSLPYNLGVGRLPRGVVDRPPAPPPGALLGVPFTQMTQKIIEPQNHPTVTYLSHLYPSVQGCIVP